MQVDRIIDALVRRQTKRWNWSNFKFHEHSSAAVLHPTVQNIHTTSHHISTQTTQSHEPNLPGSSVVKLFKDKESYSLDLNFSQLLQRSEYNYYDYQNKSSTGIWKLLESYQVYSIDANQINILTNIMNKETGNEENDTKILYTPNAYDKLIRYLD